VKKLLQNDNIRADYDRNLYYEQYYERSRNALVSLYIALEDRHLAFFKNKYDENADANSIVKSSLEGASSTMCQHVYKHMNEGKITPNLWPMCETGQGVQSCSWWKKEKMSSDDQI
jgi:hypothetical protein